MPEAPHPSASQKQNHRGSRDATDRMARPVEVPWACHKTGDCCRSVGYVTVTLEEKLLLEQHSAAAARPVRFVLHPQEEARAAAAHSAGDPIVPTPKFYQLVGDPACPFLSTQNLCMVHSVRPYRCRTFMCGRVDVSRESYELGGPLGCWNAADRINTSLRFEEYYRSHERRAQKEWGMAHGWVKGDR